jgi:hypothetical protein
VQLVGGTAERRPPMYRKHTDSILILTLLAGIALIVLPVFGA